MRADFRQYRGGRLIAVGMWWWIALFRPEGLSIGVGSVYYTACEADGNSLDRIFMLQFQDVRKGYGTGEVLKRVSFQVQLGEHVGLVGRNGSGKSTILRLIGKLEEVAGGDITFPGRWRIGAVRPDTSTRNSLAGTRWR